MPVWGVVLRASARECLHKSDFFVVDAAMILSGSFEYMEGGVFCTFLQVRAMLQVDIHIAFSRFAQRM